MPRKIRLQLEARRHALHASRRLREAGSLGACSIQGVGYGHVRYWRGFEDYGAYRLPIAAFAGGHHVAMLAVPQGDGTWRRVYSRADGPPRAEGNNKETSHD